MLDRVRQELPQPGPLMVEDLLTTPGQPLNVVGIPGEQLLLECLPEGIRPPGENLPPCGS